MRRFRVYKNFSDRDLILDRVQNKFKLPHHTEQDGHGVFHRETSYHKVTTLQLLNGWGDIVFLRKHYFNIYIFFIT